MPSDIVNFPMGGGLDRSVATHLASRDSFWEMVNFRPSRLEKGSVEQTPYFTLSKQHTAGTYYNAGSQTETLNYLWGIYEFSSTIRLTISNDCAWYGTAAAPSQLKCFFQTHTTTGTGLNSGCLLAIGSVSGLNITLGSSFDVVIDGATTFKWRKNGGAYTTLVPIVVGGVSVDGGNATVYFLKATGFTVNDTWVWTRSDWTGQTSTWVPGGAHSRPCAFVANGDAVYFVANSGVVWKLHTPVGGSAYLITAGYRHMFADRITAFADHLVLSGYARSASDTLSQYTGVSWSDRADFDNFIPADTNEADTFYFPNALLVGSELYGIAGFHVVNKQLFVFLRDSIWSTSYLGLPTVFNFEQFANVPSLTPLTNSLVSQFHSVVSAGDYAYILSLTGVLEFGGGGIRNVGAPIAYKLSTSLHFKAHTYVPFWQEVHFLVGTEILTYHQKTGLWSSRGASFTAVGGLAVCSMAADAYQEKLLLGVAGCAVLVEDTAWTAQPVYDSAVGTAYTTPKLTKHLFSDGSFLRTKEFLGFSSIVAALTTVSATYYSTLGNASIVLYTRTIAPTGVVDMAMPAAVTTSSSWNTGNNTDNSFSAPRLPFRASALEWQLSPANAAKPPGLITIANFETKVRGLVSLEK